MINIINNKNKNDVNISIATHDCLLVCSSVVVCLLRFGAKTAGQIIINAVKYSKSHRQIELVSHSLGLLVGLVLLVGRLVG